jgi:polyisoprenyl-teichoic acid--peptidoglycan teichoic acid transferase
MSTNPASAEPSRHSGSIALRLALGGLAVVLLSAAGTTVFALGEVNKVVEALHQHPPVKLQPQTLAPTAQGAPQTLLLVGNDERPPPKGNPYGKVDPHSNEMLLVRIDPSQPTISMLSIPRELQVTFTAPNGELVTNRINSAYTYGYEEEGGTSGGVKLMVETIKHLLGVSGNFPVNHVFVTNFPNFKRAVTEMGCVYMTLDRRYYHVNEPGGEQYFEINLQPGYQRLCGQQALEFVANRHEDSSLTRDARDQRFLLSVKSQYGPTALENRETFERIFGKAVETDLHGTEQVLQLLELLAESAGKPVRQVPFHVNLLPTYDTASPQQIEEAVSSFMNGTAALPTHALNHAVSSTHPHHVAAPAPRGLAPTPSATITEARSIAADLPFPVEAPRDQETTAEATPDQVRRYDIAGPGARLYPSYVMVIDRGGLGEYYDVEGTTWSEPPLLSNPTSQVHVGSRTYELFYDGEAVKTIAWHERGGTYWVENTLTDGLSPQDMAAIAEQTVPVSNRVLDVGAQSATAPVAHGFPLPRRAASTASLTEKLGSVFAFAVLAALVVLSTLLLYRRRELKALRGQLGDPLAADVHSR